MSRPGLSTVDTAGLSRAGIWVRRIRTSPNLLDEAICLAGVLQLWTLTDLMVIDSYEAYYAEISGGALTPTWVYLIDIVGQKSGDQDLISNHPLAGLPTGQPFRLVALATPTTPPSVLGALVEAEQGGRLVWLER